MTEPTWEHEGAITIQTVDGNPRKFKSSCPWCPRAAPNHIDLTYNYGGYNRKCSMCNGVWKQEEEE